ncbi:MAG: PQQ-like beta-propeller repeat protein, partial [Alphaproteobacteria bacterium]|nr:PQQ-like beta-propeller repeat protein [Alphaproteobacteria bacterium]
MRIVPLALLAGVAVLTACSMIPSWMGGSKKEAEKKLEGQRIAVLRGAIPLEPDSALATVPADTPAAVANPSWSQHAGGAAGRPDVPNPALAVSLEKRQSARVGDGNDFSYKLVTPPVVGDGAVFAMDANGMVSAHDVKDVSEVRWISPGVASEKSEAVVGGGLAYESGRVYAASGKGLVVGLNAATGVELWRQMLNIPIRSAPRVSSGRVYVTTVDSQLFALDAGTGIIVWSHRGVDEGHGFLIEPSPAVTGELVVAPYASGEIHGLRPESGEEVWNDGVVGVQRQSATALFTGIGGDPVITPDGLLYVAGSANQFAVFQAETGRRLWDQPISSLNTPQVVGDYVYVLNTDAALVCLHRTDGRVKWVASLPEFEDMEKKKNRYTWNGPVMAGGRLLVAGAHGKMMEISPQD